MVEAACGRRRSSQAVKAAPAFPHMDRLPESPRGQKVGFLEVQTGDARPRLWLARCDFSGAYRANLLGQAHLDGMPHLPFCARRSAPLAKSRRNPLRIIHRESPATRISPGMEKRTRGFPSSRLCRSKCEYRARSITESRRPGINKSSNCFHISTPSSTLCFMIFVYTQDGHGMPCPYELIAIIGYTAVVNSLHERSASSPCP
jgi:hypothetical protein